MLVSDLSISEYNPFYQTYINALGNVDLMNELGQGKKDFLSLMEHLPDEKLHFAYAEDKWSLVEALVHMIDTERIFQYRALRFARNDKTDLPGFEQDNYVPNSNAGSRTKSDLVEEYTAVRDSTITLFRSFDQDMLKRVGKANGFPMSVRALGFIINGHQAHHIRIINERYLV
ncbi:DinB family protein [Flagellimonas aequoris]|uniref:DinB family protein n=1 Tax=Flagellimonas aequoris TaxID=2306997 RepID=A0A418N4L8_9FLAO|nr:DinB family protein [Allomuricauda aequoris]RIV68814.1 DinB family protein [Allomuricauda aequoris]TXK00514.1 DinB family protein [Allomuricauda aequoris]